jgi:hypothetical protein
VKVFANQLDLIAIWQGMAGTLFEPKVVLWGGKSNRNQRASMSDNEYSDKFAHEFGCCANPLVIRGFNALNSPARVRMQGVCLGC